MFTAAYGLINAKWGWVILAAGMALIGLTYIANIGSLDGPMGTLFEEDTYASWSKTWKHLNTLGNVLTIVGVLAIWLQ